MRTWTELEKAKLRRLKVEGVKLPEIMRQLNKTKGQVCGQWNRMNGYKVPSRKKIDNRGDRTMWTDESLTERWADRRRA